MGNGRKPGGLFGDSNDSVVGARGLRSGNGGGPSSRVGAKRNRESVGKRKDPDYKNCGFILPKDLHERLRRTVMDPYVEGWIAEKAREAGIREGTYGRYGQSELIEILVRDWFAELDELLGEE